MKRHGLYIVPALLLALISCGNSGSTNLPSADEVVVEQIKAPTFSGDSAYAYTKAQCDFGPRVPNSTAHDRCGDWLVQKFTDLGATVTEQKDNVKGWDGTLLKMRNIVASYKPESGKRVLICAHWDSRPWADNDPDPKNHHTPIDGADDGASGVGIMVELARQFQQQLPEIGVDLICFDMEDYGTPEWSEAEHQDDTWCLGSQYWARNPHVSGYNARYGILLDMVGNPNSVFYQEYFSLRHAKSIVKKVWNKANDMGLGSRFLKRDGGAITDDHIPINEIAKIPCIDIIPMYPDCKESSFGPTWHTLSDNITNIDPSTLGMVGQVLMEVIYNEH